MRTVCLPVSRTPGPPDCVTILPMPVVLVLFASVLFGTTGTARALGLEGADPVAVGAARAAVGGLCLGGIAAALLMARRSRHGVARPAVRDRRVALLIG